MGFVDYNYRVDKMFDFSNIEIDQINKHEEASLSKAGITFRKETRDENTHVSL